MFDKIQVFTGENPDVKKFVFEKEDICVEAVLYKYGSYEKRTVLCISTQCGCPVGCSFCGTGKNFVRNLTTSEITEQVRYVVNEIQAENGWGLPSLIGLNQRCEKFQIMFMSMGEPMLNWFHVRGAIEELNAFFPNAQLLISTMGINDPTIFTDMIKTSIKIDKVGLQFSVHAMYDEERDRIIPFKNKMDLRQLRNSGLLWSQATGRQVFLNYCFGSTIMFNLDRVFDMFDPMSFALTFSVVCENEVGKPRTQEVKDMVTASLYTIQQRCLAEGYNVRSFDPAGQDDIGGGCGQLWYVQDWMKQNGK